ncbi:Pycsar system effector family protein [Sphaerospermopsis reniformis]|nr:Pycsar system effector family protein [Sphaerospermopsis reniformis]
MLCTFVVMDEISSKLIAIFQNVNEWLKFAEAKNGILLAFSGAAITATITILSTAQNLPNSLKIGLLLTTIILCICALVCSLSFLPKTNLERVLGLRLNLNNTNPDKDNFWFFGHLRKYDPTDLLEALNQHYFDIKLNKPYKKEYKDIAAQITINSEITFLKFRVFTYAVYVFIASIVVIPCSVLISLVIYRHL